MKYSLEEITLKAGLAICSLAQRTEQKGRKNSDEPVKSKRWIKSAFGGSLVNIDKFLEAAEYYEIARNIIFDEANRSFAIYQKGLLLEEIGEVEEAIKSYEMVSYDDSAYGSLVSMALSRCRSTQAGRPTDFSDPSTMASLMNQMMPGMGDQFSDLIKQASQGQEPAKGN